MNKLKLTYLGILFSEPTAPTRPNCFVTALIELISSSNTLTIRPYWVFFFLYMYHKFPIDVMDTFYQMTLFQSQYLWYDKDFSLLKDNNADQRNILQSLTCALDCVDLHKFNFCSTTYVNSYFITDHETHYYTLKAFRFVPWPMRFVSFSKRSVQPFWSIREISMSLT